VANGHYFWQTKSHITASPDTKLNTTKQLAHLTAVPAAIRRRGESMHVCPCMLFVFRDGGRSEMKVRQIRKLPTSNTFVGPGPLGNKQTYNLVTQTQGEHTPATPDYKSETTRLTIVTLYNHTLLLDGVLKTCASTHLAPSSCNLNVKLSRSHCRTYAPKLITSSTKHIVI
jgi:hypothetical protein